MATGGTQDAALCNRDAVEAKRYQLTFWLQLEEVEAARFPESPGILAQAA